MDRTAGLDSAYAHALGWLDSLADATRAAARSPSTRWSRAWTPALQDGPTAAAAVVDQLAGRASPG